MQDPSNLKLRSPSDASRVLTCAWEEIPWTFSHEHQKVFLDEVVIHDDLLEIFISNDLETL